MAPKKKRKVQPGARSLVCASEALAVLRETPSCASTLRRVHKMLLHGGPASASFGEDLVAHGFLHLIPSIFSQSSRKSVATGIEVLGALSMSSFTTHRKVVGDKDAMNALTEIFVRTDMDLLTTACHAVVDLLITPFGCEALKESAVLNHLLHLLCWIADVPKEAQNGLVGEGRPLRVAGEPLVNCSESRNPQSKMLLAPMSSEKVRTTCRESIIVNSALENAPFCKEFSELVIMALTAISALLRYRGIGTVSKDVLCNVLSILRRYWHSLLRKDQILLNSTAGDDEPKWTCNRQTRHLVAKCVVQIAMEHDSIYTGKLSVQHGLFQSTYFSLELFLDKYWEQAPVLLGKEMPSCLSALSKNFTSLAAVVNNFLAWSVACPPAFADQVDPLHLFEDIEGNLGEPMIYGQDIHIVKTVLSEPDTLSTLKAGATVEMHHNRNGAISNGQGARHVHPQEILEAVERGYTLAIKGMELRCPDVADTADCLARQCGQPSVGVNLYLTPPNAQGLDLHFDDHCVFVCQLVGRKTWNVSPPQKLLPRLYANRTLNHGAPNSIPSTLFNLEEGNVLYIPRGYLHKAHSGQPKDISVAHLTRSWDLRADASSLWQRACSPSGERLHGVDHIQKRGDNTDKEKSVNSGSGAGEHSGGLDSIFTGFYSLHLTFGVEVEPPFEWEGLVHIALRLWAEQRWKTLAVHSRSDLDSKKESRHRLEQLCEGLLHIAINILGEKEILLRKACMISAEIVGSLHPRSHVGPEHLASPEAISFVLGCGSGNSAACKFCDANSLNYFQTLLELVAQKANYQEAYSFARGAANEFGGSCIGGMEWLRHVPLPAGQSTASGADPISFLLRTTKMNELKGFDKSEVEAAFANMKAEFGQALMFHQASDAFKSVWNQYKTMRMKFMNGMLALHDNFY